MKEFCYLIIVRSFFKNLSLINKFLSPKIDAYPVPPRSSKRNVFLSVFFDVRVSGSSVAITNSL